MGRDILALKFLYEDSQGRKIFKTRTGGKFVADIVYGIAPFHFHCYIAKVRKGATRTFPGGEEARWTELVKCLGIGTIEL